MVRALEAFRQNLGFRKDREMGEQGMRQGGLCASFPSLCTSHLAWDRYWSSCLMPSLRKLIHSSEGKSISEVPRYFPLIKKPFLIEKVAERKNLGYLNIPSS